MLSAVKLKRVIFVNMVLGPRTTTQLTVLNKHKIQGNKKRSFAIDLRDCRLINFEERLPDLATSEHPLMNLKLANIQMLTLVKSNLRDGHLESILNSILHIELLDISFNNFTTDGIVEFILNINKKPNHLMNLRSINISGNSLKDADSEIRLQRGLVELLQKLYIQHVDLSLC